MEPLNSSKPLSSRVFGRHKPEAPPAVLGSGVWLTPPVGGVIMAPPSEPKPSPGCTWTGAQRILAWGKRLDISVVVPVLNEEENLPTLHQRLTEALAGNGYSYEIIIVDDGSTDRSFDIMQEIQAQDDRLRVVRFRRNYGQTAAFAAGFDRAQGDVVVTIDADLQNDPADIPALMAKQSSTLRATTSTLKRQSTASSSPPMRQQRAKRGWRTPSEILTLK